ncbi:hypothetical protein KBZ12_17755 [Cyanobium sp. Cruz CV13-4-11]|nr:hypothetical protein [Cyanobium sp. Cruz CV13-4-11]MCP9902427.1 hypothetical protein [Cyanobium sp. Cruz CV11-17]MCP9921283.1 hypothetical protein [Cyanobium sp. Cruz CV13-4-11]
MISAAHRVHLNLQGNQMVAKEIFPESSESAESAVAPEPMSRITVSLPRSLCRQFRLHAFDQDTTLSSLMARLIRQELSGNG